MLVLDGSAPRHRDKKVWRRGFIRWRRREGPTGSHQLEASALKWETSVGSTVDFGGEVEGAVEVAEEEEEEEVEEKRISGVELGRCADCIRVWIGGLTGERGCLGIERKTRMEREAFMAMSWW